MEYPNVKIETAARIQESPYDHLEELVTRVWEEVFNLEKIDPHANFFELGGSSVLGMDITELLATRLGVEITVLTLFQHPSIREMADVIAAGR